MNRTLKVCMLGVLIATAPPLLAEPRATDASARVAVPPYESAFSGYKPFREKPLADWRGVNEEVGRVGGHIGIFGGAGGHGHGGSAAPKPGAAESGQPPMRGAPAAPGVKAQHHSR